MTIPLIPTGGNGPLLTYSLRVRPDPLASGGRGALDLAVANGGSEPIACNSIQLSLPVGTNATDLIDAGAAIHTRPPAGWTAQADSGVVTFTAPGGSVNVDGQGLLFTIAITPNAQPGTASVMLTESASDEDDPPQQRSGTFAVDKFPADFSLSDLTFVPPDKPDVPHGHPAILNWTAAGAGVSCILEYQPANDGDVVNGPVPNAAPGGAYTTAPLTRDQSVTFTLIAKVSVPGKDDPMILQRQLTVTVESLSLSLEVQPPTVGKGGLAKIVWDAPNADHCSADDGQILPASGTAYVVMQETHVFTVTAFAGDQQVQKQATIEVSSSITPTEPGFSIIGPTGQQGADGATVSGNPNQDGTVVINGTTVSLRKDADGTLVWTMDGKTRVFIEPTETAIFQAMSGQPGAAGGDGVLTETLPPLDSSGQPLRVIPITVTGGTGGQGGKGGNWPGAGGVGGQGGNARVAVTIDQSQPPAQYIVTLAGGSGGTGGTATAPGFDGNPGSPGRAAMAFDGVIVALDGALAAPRPSRPALTVSAKPSVVAVNGVALMTWNSPNCDHCVLPDGSIVPPSGERYIIVPATQDVSVTGFNAFDQTTVSARVTVDSSIKPTEPGTSMTGAAGVDGVAGTNGSFTFPPLTVTPSTPGTAGGAGGDATITLTIPPPDATGASTRVIPVTATGGDGGKGGAGGFVEAPTTEPEFASAGGPGGPGGNATVTLTVDPSLPPAQLIIEVTPGHGGAGGANGWLDGVPSDPVPSTAPSGTPGAASLTIDGVAVIQLPLPDATSVGDRPSVAVMKERP